jgi:hypothetical protein
MVESLRVAEGSKRDESLNLEMKKKKKKTLIINIKVCDCDTFFSSFLLKLRVKSK